MVASHGDLLDVQAELGDLILQLTIRIDELESKVRALFDDLEQHEMESAEESGVELLEPPTRTALQGGG